MHKKDEESGLSVVESGKAMQDFKERSDLIGMTAVTRMS